MYIPLAKKYRPKSLDHVVGQDAVVRIIGNSIKNKKLNYSYMFHGNKGCGKTSTARIMAATENFPSKESLTPNLEDDNCKAIFEGKSLGIKEFDAASNRGIDDIRRIQHDAYKTSFDVKVKYYIIDEAHGLTDPAFQAALKMVEEPPKNVRFIFCTTEPHKIPETIQSRCTTISFRKVHWIEIKKNILEIAKKEKFNITDEAVADIAKNSNGSVRDSLNYLDKIISYSGEDASIDSDTIVSVLGIASQSLIGDIVDGVFENNGFKSFISINELLVKGTSPESLIDGLLEHLRRILVCRVTKQNVDYLHMNEEEYKTYMHKAKKYHPNVICEMMNNLQNVRLGMKVNVDVQAMLESWVTTSIVANARISKKS